MGSLRIMSLLLAGLTVGSSSAGGQKADKVAFEVFARPYFVKNNAPLPGNPAYLVVPDKKSFDTIFGAGFVMGKKPKVVNDKLFESNRIVTVIKSGSTLWQYQVEQVRVEKKRLIVRYTAAGKESATAKFTVPLIVSVPHGDYTEVAFVENGKEVGKAAVK